jgi:hypothetical protein
MSVLVNYTTTFNKYASAQQIKSDCNSITFFNSGTTMMVIESVQFFPGQQLQIDGNVGEYTNQVFNLQFTSLGAGTVDEITVIRKNYI